MRINFDKNDFELVYINEHYHENFWANKKDTQELSDFEEWALKAAGDSLRKRETEHFWSEGRFCWYVDKMQSHQQCVFITRNGCLIFHDEKKNELYRVRPLF